MADSLPPRLAKVPTKDGRPADAIDLSAKIIGDLASLRAKGRVPTALAIIIQLPESPMGGEVGTDCTVLMPFAQAEADPGLIGAAVRALTRNNSNG